jgi:cytochrome c biogenesis protein CcmG/thiol:disulfide interchange protein DsbE
VAKRTNDDSVSTGQSTEANRPSSSPRRRPTKARIAVAATLATITAVLVAAAILAAFPVSSGPKPLADFSGGSSLPPMDGLVGRRLPPFVLPEVTPSDRSIDSASLHGAPLVVVFWSPSCPPCRKELPELSTLALSEAPRAHVVGVDVGTNRSSAARFLSSHHVAFPSAFDPSDHLAEAWKVVGTPTTFVLGPNGTVRAVKPGPWSPAAIRRVLAKLSGTDHASGRSD